MEARENMYNKSQIKVLPENDHSRVGQLQGLQQEWKELRKLYLKSTYECHNHKSQWLNFK